MTNTDGFLPNHTRRVLFLAYPGFELLDLGGPVTVFQTANRLSGQPLYRTEVMAPRAGAVPGSSGIVVQARSCARIRLGSADTVLVLGAWRESLAPAMADPALLACVRRAAQRAGRLGSVCSGTFLLAAAGVLAGRRVTTHWAGQRQLERYCPGAQVTCERLYVRDGPLWTSAGVSTGIDMALAMVQADHGAALMAEVAQYLVLHAHRPGHQSQFSSAVPVQGSADGRFASLAAWLAQQPEADIDVAAMAAHCGMSERTFHRRFRAATGVTPSRYRDLQRLQWARQLLEQQQPVKAVSSRAGYRSEAAFRSAFRAAFGVAPGHHARMYRRTAAP